MLGLMDGSLAGVSDRRPARLLTVPNLDDEVKATVEAALDAMAAGATLVECGDPHADAARHAQRVTMISEAYAYHEPDLKSEKPELYGKYTRQAFQLGAFYSAADYVNAQRLRPLIRQECADAFGTTGPATAWTC